MKFRDYQIDATKKVINKLVEGERRILLHSPTGSGKTVIGGKIIIDIPEEYQRVLFIVNKEALLLQAYKTFRRLKISTFIVHNKITHDRDLRPVNKNGLHCKVLITLIGSRDNIEANFKPDLIIIDEAHKGTSQSFQELAEEYGVPVIGLTATPHRAKDKEGESLNEWYGDNLLTAISYADLVKQKYLVPLKYTSLGEEAHVVRTWLHYTNNDTNKRTILFTRDTKHSLEMKEAFLSNGISAEIITSGDEEGNVLNQSNKVRNEIFNKFEAGEIDVLISVMALCEGFDEPRAKYCFICRRISNVNVALFHQICGRVSRPFEGKEYGHVVDFGDNYTRFGSLEEYEYNDLSFTNSVKNVTPGERLHFNYNPNRRLMMCCGECQHVYDINKNPKCYHCKTPNTIKLYGSVGDLRKNLISQIPAEKWVNFKKHFKFLGRDEANEVKAFRHLCLIAQKAVKMKQEYAFNKMYFGLFYPGTWAINPEFAWVLQIKLDTRMEDNLEWSLFNETGTFNTVGSSY